MKKLLIIMTTMISLTSCSKSDDDFGTSLQSQVVEPIRPKRHLTLRMLDVDNDVVKNITGRYNGTTFVMWNNALNFCGGAQGVEFNYTIYK